MEDERKRGMKYIEGYVDKKVSSKWATYWTVIRGTQLFFFTDPNTHIQENFVGTLDLGPLASCAKGKKKKDRFEFELKTEYGKKHLLRVTSDILRQQWLYAIGLSSQLKSPSLLPGEPGFEGDPASPEASPRSTPNSYNSESNSSTTSLTSPVSPDSIMFKFDGMDERKLIHRQSGPLSFDQHAARHAAISQKRDSMPVGTQPPTGHQTPEQFCRPATPPSVQPVSPHHVNHTSQSMPEWYLGKISRDGATDILNKQRVGAFLVRDSETAKLPGSYTLSLRHRDKCRHHKIETLHGQLVIKGYEKHPFPCLEVLLKFFIQTQEKDIKLFPYIPTAPRLEEAPKPEYEIMDHHDEYLTEDVSRMSLQHEPLQGSATGSMNGRQKRSTTPPPPLPSRKPGGPQHSYENVASKEREGASPPTPRRTLPQSYENIPSKGKARAAPVPPLPPRVNAGPHSYENVASKTPPRPGSYENMPERDRVPQSYQNIQPRIPVPQAYQNIPERPLSQTPSGPIHSYQNLPPKVTPRQSVAPRRVQTFNSDSKPTIPQRTKPPPVRRRRTANESDWAKKGF